MRATPVLLSRDRISNGRILLTLRRRRQPITRKRVVLYQAGRGKPSVLLRAAFGGDLLF
jgi:hypothetical protein